MPLVQSPNGDLVSDMKWTAIGQLYKCLCRGPGPVEGVGGGGQPLHFGDLGGGGVGPSTPGFTNGMYTCTFN